MHNAAQPPKHRFDIRACARVIAPPTMQSTHSQLHRAAYALFYVITFRCLSSPFSSFIAFCRYCDRQSTSHALYLRRFAFARTQLDKPVYPHPDCQPTRTAIFISHALREAYSNFAAKARARPLLPPTLPPDTLFCLFRLPLFPQAVQGSAFLCVLVSCGTYVLSSAKPQRLSEFLLVYAYLYTASLHVFRLCVCFSRPCDPFPVAAPRLTPLSYTRFRVPLSRMLAVSSNRSFRDRVSRPPFLDLFSSHTCDRRDVRSFCLYFSLPPDFVFDLLSRGAPAVISSVFY